MFLASDGSYTLVVGLSDIPSTSLCTG
ncbi:hypothetical protein Taro_047092 [Colocasia esculenta]|uniref:Uncharacterized protein n=1 Tax=Colocasia esculenta TaxID=4460 RepID=A0A843X6B3_COLES|nr:hypothetical protein [Colocasia esculenta]